MDIHQIPISEIKPYWRNPRNNELAVEVVRKSIEDFGFNVPIAVDLDKVILAGHTRYRALLGMGVEEVPCVMMDISEDKARAFRIADNAAAEVSRWDEELLAKEILETYHDVDLTSYFDGLNEAIEERVAGLAEPVEYLPGPDAPTANDSPRLGGPSAFGGPFSGGGGESPAAPEVSVDTTPLFRGVPIPCMHCMEDIYVIVKGGSDGD